MFWRCNRLDIKTARSDAFVNRNVIMPSFRQLNNIDWVFGDRSTGRCRDSIGAAVAANRAWLEFLLGSLEPLRRLLRRLRSTRLRLWTFSVGLMCGPVLHWYIQRSTSSLLVRALNPPIQLLWAAFHWSWVTVKPLWFSVTSRYLVRASI